MMLFLKKEERYWETTGCLCHRMFLFSFLHSGKRAQKKQAMLSKVKWQSMNFNQVHLTPKQIFRLIQPTYFGHQGARCLLRNKRYFRVNSYSHSDQPRVHTECGYKEIRAVRVMQLGKAIKTIFLAFFFFFFF